MSETESFQERQESEFTALKSIFGDSICDLRENKESKEWEPLEVVVTLTPQQGMSGPGEVHAQIDLHVVCGEKYPEEIPHIKLQNSRGLSYQQIAILLSELDQIAIQKRGEVMILDFAQHIGQFLCEYNKPSYESFYDEMVSRQETELQMVKEKEKLKEMKDKQVMYDAIEKHQEALKAEPRNVRKLTYSFTESNVVSESIPSTSRERNKSHSTSESSERKGTKFIHFYNARGERQVQRGKCLGRNATGSAVYTGVDMKTGELLAITEWILKYNTSGESRTNSEAKDLHYLKKQIASIEQELNYLHKLRHPNLVHYLNMKYVQNKDSILIYVLQELVVGTTCSFYLVKNIPIGINMLRHLASGILLALQYLHDNNVVHKDLRDTSIHIEHTGAVRLSDYSLDKRLSNISSANYLAKVERDFPTKQGKGRKEADIYRFGALLLSLLKGSIISETEIDWGTILQPSLRDFLSKCLVDDEKMRWSAEELLQHGFIRCPLEHGVSSMRLDYNKKQDNLETGKPTLDAHTCLSGIGGQSRIQNEFDILKWLGKGAFGDVLKAMNKLDGGIYAIKRIKLNPKNKQLNRKITREVKLLSRLNHENVVRYYNSWIESAILNDPARRSQLTPVAPSMEMTTERNVHDETDLGSGDVEKLAPPIHNVEWNVLYKSRASVVHSANSEENNSDSSSDSDSDRGWDFLTQTVEDSSNIIEFAKDSALQISDSVQGTQKDLSKVGDGDNSTIVVKEIQFLYIQMEFCEKSTLRTAIDNGLWKDNDRVWRLFREMVEGLAHIHQQGMIHRDLKPMNIFLDSNDHVKIGDFGLATTNILSNLVQPVDVDKELQLTEKGAHFDFSELELLTGQVGTTLYVAPELSTKTAKAIYNQKVDIYSLGIIFFEMCYEPLTTGMERVKVLLNLRTKEIILPSRLTEADMPQQVHLLRWLLNHDPSQRPTPQELLSSKLLPPPQQLEEAELQEMVRHTFSDNQSKMYKYLMDCCFAQNITPAEDVVYDMIVPIKDSNNTFSPKTHFLQESIKYKVIEIFQRHGGVDLATPLLMPISEQFSHFTDSCMKLMTRTGSIVALPHDLRTPFARYIARYNIPHFRRYAIERVYREKMLHGVHPREFYECAFDIISSTANHLMAEAELISIVWEIILAIPELRERNFTIRLNHTLLLQAVLMYCGIDEKKYQDIYSILRDARNGTFSKFQVQTRLTSLCLTDQAMETLFKILDSESCITKVTDVLKTITRREGDVGNKARKGLQEIETVIGNIEVLDIKWPITIVPLLVHNVQQHSGAIYQVICEPKRKRKRSCTHVIAAGGRYNEMLMDYKKIMMYTRTVNKEVEQYGVGISISLDKLVYAIKESSENESGENKFNIDVAVCYIDGMLQREKEMINVLRQLWSSGLRVIFLDLCTVEEISEYCRENSINHIVMLKNGERENLRVQSYEKDRFEEQEITMNNIANYLRRQTDNSLSVLNRSDSKTSSNVDTFTSSSNPVNVNVNFVLTEKDKLSGSARKSFKNVLLAQITSYLQKISHKISIEVFAFFLEISVIRTMMSYLEMNKNELSFQTSIQLIIDKHPRHKKYIEQICEEIRKVRNDKLQPVLIFYSLIDNKYKCLM